MEITVYGVRQIRKRAATHNWRPRDPETRTSFLVASWRRSLMLRPLAAAAVLCVGKVVVYNQLLLIN